MGFGCLICDELLESPAPESAQCSANAEPPKIKKPRAGAKKAQQTPASATDSVVTPCGHVFHELCIHQWFKDKNSGTCPVCRQMCTKAKLIRIFPSMVEDCELPNTVQQPKNKPVVPPKPTHAINTTSTTAAGHQHQSVVHAMQPLQSWRGYAPGFQLSAAAPPGNVRPSQLNSNPLMNMNQQQSNAYNSSSFVSLNPYANPFTPGMSLGPNPAMSHSQYNGSMISSTTNSQALSTNTSASVTLANQSLPSSSSGITSMYYPSQHSFRSSPFIPNNPASLFVPKSTGGQSSSSTSYLNGGAVGAAPYIDLTSRSAAGTNSLNSNPHIPNSSGPGLTAGAASQVGFGGTNQARTGTGTGTGEDANNKYEMLNIMHQTLVADFSELRQKYSDVKDENQLLKVQLESCYEEITKLRQSNPCGSGLPARRNSLAPASHAQMQPTRSYAMQPTTSGPYPAPKHFTLTHPFAFGPAASMLSLPPQIPSANPGFQALLQSRGDAAAEFRSRLVQKSSGPSSSTAMTATARPT